MPKQIIWLLPITLTSCLFVLAGCGHIPAKSEQLGEGVHRLSATGNVFAEKALLQEKLDIRASRICGGDDSYEYIDEGSVKSFEQDATVSGASATGSYQIYTRLMRCKND